MRNHIEHYYQVEDFFFRLMNRQRLSSDEGCAYVTGVQAENLNPLMLRSGVTPDLGDRLNQCQTVFSQEQLSWIIVLPSPRLDSQSKVILADNGLLFSETSTAI